jgi:beta-lactamase class A
MIGQTISHYNILEKPLHKDVGQVGEGGMGICLQGPGHQAGYTMTKHFSLSFLCVFVFLSSGLHSQGVKSKTDRALTKKLTEVAKEFKGDYGIYVRNLKTGATAEINADTLFPTASMIKVPILCALFDRMNLGELKYSQEMLYRDSMAYGGAGVSHLFKDSSKVPLAELVWLMIAISDNTAALWCQFLAGTGTAINEWLEKNGFHQTRVNSRTPGREANRSEHGWGQTTPREMAELLSLIREGKAVNSEASEEMYRVLSKPYWDVEALSQIPPTIHVAAKNGAVNASRSEVVLVNAPSGDYVFCVITKNQGDQRWEHDNEGYVLIRNVSQLLWNYFEPKSKWSAPKTDRWHK